MGKNKDIIASFRIKTPKVVKKSREPTTADADISGFIDKRRLYCWDSSSPDAFGAGFGAACAGFKIIWSTILVSVMSLLFLSIGLNIGNKKLVFLNERLTKYLPGYLLLALAAFKALKK